MNDTSERDAVVAWVIGALGWTLHKVDPKPKGKTVYVFWEPDSDGWNTEHKIAVSRLRWRYMQPLGMQHVPELRAKADALWAEYLTQRRKIR